MTPCFQSLKHVYGHHSNFRKMCLIACQKSLKSPFLIRFKNGLCHLDPIFMPFWWWGMNFVVLFFNEFIHEFVRDDKISRKGSFRSNLVMWSIWTNSYSFSLLQIHLCSHLQVNRNNFFFKMHLWIKSGRSMLTCLLSFVPCGSYFSWYWTFDT